MQDDKQFLQWIFDRLAHQHNENENYDYMYRLKAIIEAIPPGVCSKANGCITVTYKDIENQVKLANEIVKEIIYEEKVMKAFPTSMSSAEKQVFAEFLLSCKTITQVHSFASNILIGIAKTV